MPDDDRPPPPVVEIVNRLREAHGDERRRTARDLHDRVAHALSVALNSLELHQTYVRSNPPRAQAQLSNATSAIRSSLEAVHALCSDLRRREVVDGLEGALREYLRTVAPATIAWAVRVTGDESQLPAEMCDELFLILREAAHNSLLHSSARHLTIVAQLGPDAARATVSDDGIGFDVGRHGEAGGLASIRERAELLGGHVQLSSTPGAGTTVHVHLPLPAAPDDW